MVSRHLIVLCSWGCAVVFDQRWKKCALCCRPASKANSSFLTFDWLTAFGVSNVCAKSPACIKTCMCNCHCQVLDYSTTKAAIVGYTKGAAMLLMKNHGIRVNAGAHLLTQRSTHTTVRHKWRSHQIYILLFAANYWSLPLRKTLRLVQS